MTPSKRAAYDFFAILSIIHPSILLSLPLFSRFNAVFDVKIGPTATYLQRFYNF